MTNDRPTGWIEPPDPTVRGFWWITRREADHAPGYGGPPVLPDIRVCWEWHVEERCWIKGSLRDRQNREIPHNVVIHGNNGWRIEGPGEKLVP